MKNLFNNYLAFLKEGNILGILQLFLIWISSFIYILIYIFNFSEYTLYIYIISYVIISISLYINKEFLLGWTNKILISFISSFYGQLFIFYMARLEMIILNSPSIYVLPLFVTPVALLVSGFENDPLIIQQLLFIFFVLIFNWWRFRTSFFNLETLTRGSDIKTKELEFKWSSFILLFNTYFANKTTSNKSFNNIKIPDRLSSTWAQAALNMYKHNPKTALGIGSAFSAYVVGDRVREQYNITRNLAQQEAQFKENLLKEKAEFKENLLQKKIEHASQHQLDLLKIEVPKDDIERKALIKDHLNNNETFLTEAKKAGLSNLDGNSPEIYSCLESISSLI